MPKPIAGRVPITVVQGAQWGSEGKGGIAAYLSHPDADDVTHIVRTGTVNAGHTVFHGGSPFVCQQLPTGWVNPRTKLVLGPGAYIHPDILAKEIAMVSAAMGEDIRQRLFIDHRCGLHLPLHTDRAKTANRHHSMGATGKGCSEAVTAKIRGRGNGGQLFIDWYKDNQMLALGDLQFTDTEAVLNRAWDKGARILVEGTQGTFLDLHLGPYPYTTHKQTQCGNWLAECGLSPALPVEVVLVTRTFPIRVAGNSGPMPKEIRWVDLAQTINERLVLADLPLLVQPESLAAFDDACVRVAYDYITSSGWNSDDLDPSQIFKIEHWTQVTREAHSKFVSELHRDALKLLTPGTIADLSRLFELTTVTKKLRRIAELDLGMLAHSIRLNRPKYLVVTFANYLFPELWGWHRFHADAGSPPPRLANAVRGLHYYVRNLEEKLGVEVRYVTTGPEHHHVLDCRPGSWLWDSLSSRAVTV